MTAYVDFDNVSIVGLNIDVSQSHTNYSDPGRDIIGRFVYFTWSLLPSNAVIPKQISFHGYKALFTACSIVRWVGNFHRTVG